ncbi:hypothetical protein COU58_02320 [Candidatus Pacearchaeota archaeon CG10_big_fil_rev_8_21_14_0_10_32_42]|nr:MAG: hypothetical protein COU58_02320 [Candidatus Pacearchaeota archaeon CG10_big_fil_rev_8_21_14_0_10_32_42]
MNKDKIRFNDHFFAWAFIYAIAVFLSIQSIRFFNLSGSLSGIFLAGLIITLFSWMVYSFLYKNKFRLSKWFFIWLFTHSFNFWLIDLVLRKLTLTYGGFLYFLILGIVYHPITWIIKHKIYYKIRMNMQKTIIIILILIVALIFASSQPFSEIQTSGLIGNNSLGFSFGAIDSIWSSINPCAKFPLDSGGVIICNDKGELVYGNQGSSPWDYAERQTSDLIRLNAGMECVLECNKESTTSQIKCIDGTPMVICR